MALSSYPFMGKSESPQSGVLGCLSRVSSRMPRIGETWTLVRIDPVPQDCS